MAELRFTYESELMGREQAWGFGRRMRGFMTQILELNDGEVVWGGQMHPPMSEGLYPVEFHADYGYHILGQMGGAEVPRIQDGCCDAVRLAPRQAYVARQTGLAVVRHLVDVGVPEDTMVMVTCEPHMWAINEMTVRAADVLVLGG